MTDPIKVLTLTTLYPNSEQAHHGLFVRHRLKKLVENHPIEAKVVAPVPWFPISWGFLGKYAMFSKVKKYEQQGDIEVWHPKYLVIPKLGMSIAPFLMAICILSKVKKMLKQGFEFELIDAHYIYPDGVAAVLIGKLVGKPVVITARGSDINVIMNYMLPRLLIKWAINNASAVITVSKALRDKIKNLDVSQSDISVLRNGVDLTLFRPSENRNRLRKSLNLSKKTILSVGNLIPLKGHHLIIEALIDLPGCELLIAGAGPEELKLKQLAAKYSLDNKVFFLGSLNQVDLQKYYSASDVLVLASESEGWANVLLESMACGTPVVATNVGGASEIVQTETAGILVKARNVESIRAGIKRMIENYPNRVEVRQYAELFSWKETSDGQYELFKKIMRESMA